MKETQRHRRRTSVFQRYWSADMDALNEEPDIRFNAPHASHFSATFGLSVFPEHL